MNIREFTIKCKSKDGNSQLIEKDGKAIWVPIKSIGRSGTLQPWIIEKWRKKNPDEDWRPIHPKYEKGGGVMEEAEIEITITQKITVQRRVPVWYPKSQIKENRVPLWIINKKKQELEEKFTQIAEGKGKKYDKITVNFAKN